MFLKPLDEDLLRFSDNVNDKIKREVTDIVNVLYLVETYDKNEQRFIERELKRYREKK